MEHTLVTSDKAKHRGWVGFERIPTPPNYKDLSQVQLEAYVISYISDLPIYDLMLLVHSDKRRKFIYFSSDPQNSDKKPEELWKQSGYTKYTQFNAAMTCPITQTCIKRLKMNHMKANLKNDAGILDPDDLLNILSSIVSSGKAPLADGKKWQLKNPQIYMKAIENLMKANGMLDNRIKIDGDISLEIKLPESDEKKLLETKPIKQIHGEVIDVESEEEE